MNKKSLKDKLNEVIRASSYNLSVEEYEKEALHEYDSIVEKLFVAAKEQKFKLTVAIKYALVIDMLEKDGLNVVQLECAMPSPYEQYKLADYIPRSVMYKISW